MLDIIRDYAPAINYLSKKIKPENVTGRTPRQIVIEAEATWLFPHLVPTPSLIVKDEIPMTAHLDVCRCMQCFNLKLDALIAMQERDLEEVDVNAMS